MWTDFFEYKSGNGTSEFNVQIQSIALANFSLLSPHFQIFTMNCFCKSCFPSLECPSHLICIYLSLTMLQCQVPPLPEENNYPVFPNHSCPESHLLLSSRSTYHLLQQPCFSPITSVCNYYLSYWTQMTFYAALYAFVSNN